MMQRTALRLFLTVWIVYAVHLSTNVVRETYLAISLGERFSVRVDEYLGLHPDLFEIPGRGAYINNNPGASMLGAVPYTLARPVLAVLFRLKPDLIKPKPAARYDDPRPNRTKFMNAARARGLDVKLGLAAIAMQVGLMAPLGALAAVVMFLFLRHRLPTERDALLYAALYAFATPIFFRSAFLNQNAIITHLVLFAFVAMVGIRPRTEPVPSRTLAGIGAMLGFGLVCDYSTMAFLVVFGLWILSESLRTGGVGSAIRASSAYVGGALGPIALLLVYQWIAFGNPIFPAQRYMPATEYSVRGWFGFSIPSAELIWGNLFDLRYGLFAFCPLLLAAIVAPFVRQASLVSRRDLWWAFGCCAALYVFSSANQFANLQWNTGVRYMVPAAPLLFIAAVPVLRAAPRVVFWPLVGASLLISWVVSMTRESVPVALRLVFTEGPMLPTTIVLRKMASGYGALAPGRWAPLVIFAVVGLALWLLWRRPLESRRVPRAAEVEA
jgi:hypothetical protein